MSDEGNEPGSNPLVGTSYDSFMAVEKRLRKLNDDIYIPLRGGLTHSQIIVFVLTFIATVLLQGLLTSPLLGLFGIPVPLWAFLIVSLGVPTLASWRVTKPMPQGKSIPGTVLSIVRYALDSPVHRRGKPVRTPKQPHDIFMQHYVRSWAVAADYAREVPGEGDWTDPKTERLFASSGAAVELQEWMDAHAIEHAKAQDADRQQRTKEAVVSNDRRGVAATVEG